MSNSPADSIKIVAGRPSDTVTRSRVASWSFGGLVPRANLTNYKAREGRTVLDTLRLIRDRDPDAAQAVTNFLLLMGQGYHSEAMSGDDVDQNAQEYLSALDARVGSEYGGGMDALVDVLNLTLVTQGAMALEIQVADDLTEVVDFHPVGPQVVTAKREKETRRLMWGLQVARGTAGADAEGFLELSSRQFRYMPLHPDVDDPYGRSPILAALTAVFFKVQVLEDLRAVVHNQGYPRIKASILEEVITNNLPAGSTLAQRTTLVQELQASVSTQLAALNPDDAITMPSSVDIGYLGVPGSTLVDVKALSEVLDKQIISGLKQLPILLGRNEGATTTHATIQWKIHVLLIEALRRRTKRLIEWAHTTALQVAGFQARAHVSFEELQTNDRLVDAQALETEVRTWGAMVDRGWASDEEAAQALLHHDPVPPAPNDGKTAGSRTTQPILGYHIEQGVVSRNESREQLGLEPQDETQSERLRTLQAVLTVVQAAVNTGLPLEAALELAGLEVTLPDEPPDAARRARQVRRRILSRTRAVAPHDAERRELEDELRDIVGGHFTRLAGDYPVGTVVEQVSGLSEIDQAEVERIVAEWFAEHPGQQWSQELTDIMVEHYRMTFNVIGQLALDDLSITGSFELKNPRMLELLDELGAERVTGIDAETRRTIVNRLVDGVTAGEGVEQLGRRIRAHIDDMSVRRAQLIAVTETATAAGMASLETYERNGVEQKGWITAGDDKVTEGCQANADASPLKMGASFPSGHDAPPRFPGCRCAVTPILDGYTAPDKAWTGA